MAIIKTSKIDISRNRISIIGGNLSDNSEQNLKASFFEFEKENNDLLEELKTNEKTTNITNFMLLGDFENQLNEIQLKNKEKLFKIELLKYKISKELELKKFADYITCSMSKSIAFKDKALNFSSASIKKKNLKTTYFPPKEEQNHEFLFLQVQKMKDMEVILSDLIGEEESVTTNLQNLHVKIKNDIVKLKEIACFKKFKVRNFFKKPKVKI